jgi:Protein O-mannosyl-transferase TMEM260-like
MSDDTKLEVEEATPAARATSAARLDDDRPPYRAAAIAGGLVFALYALTLARTTAFWDTSEYIATAHILGIPHPPGNPLFVVLARAWSVLLAPLGLSVAVRVNLFSALMSATAHGLWFLVVHHILRFFSDDRRFRLIGAAAAVLVSATAFTVWNQSNVNEKVYTVSLLTIALLSWLAFRWQEKLGQGKDDNLLILMAFILALSVGNHLMAFLAAPAVGLFILYVRPQTLLNWRLYLAGAVAVILGVSIHLFLPLRAGLNPVINEAAPTCPDIGSALTAVVTYGKAGCVALSEALNRTQYDKPALTPRLASLPSQFVNYLQYFDWQWARSLDGANTVFANFRLPFTMVFTGLGIWGAIEHARRDRASFLYVATLFGTLSVALVYYLNFKYGYSLQAPQGAAHEVRERDYFFVVSFSIWGLWAGIGIASLWREAAHEMGVTLAKAAPILALAFLPLGLNWSWASRAKDYTARDWAYNLLMSVEPYGVLFTNGDNDTFPLWYLQEAEGIRRDVTVLVTSYLNTPWYTEQVKALTAPCPPGTDPASDWSRNLCQRPYTAENTGAAYVADAADAGDKIPLVMDHEIRVPTKSIIPLTDDQIEAVARSVVPIDTTRQLQIGNVVATIEGGRYLMPWHQYALSLINQVIDERPVYFASSGNAASELGVNDYLVREGLAFRLKNGMPEGVEEGEDGVVRMQASPYVSVVGNWVDVPRTRTLLDDVFIHRSGIPDGWTHWPDIATIGIPNYYAWAYLALTAAAIQADDGEAIAKYQERAEAWTLLGS